MPGKLVLGRWPGQVNQIARPFADKRRKPFSFLVTVPAEPFSYSATRAVSALVIVPTVPPVWPIRDLALENSFTASCQSTVNFSVFPGQKSFVTRPKGRTSWLVEGKTPTVPLGMELLLPV